MITNCQSLVIHAQGEDSKKGQLIYLTRKGSFQVNLYKMIRFLSGTLKKHTKLAKIVKISEIFNRLVFPLNFNRFCHPMTLTSKSVKEIMTLNHYYATKAKITKKHWKVSELAASLNLIKTKHTFMWNT